MMDDGLFVAARCEEIKQNKDFQRCILLLKQLQQSLSSCKSQLVFIHPRSRKKKIKLSLSVYNSKLGSFLNTILNIMLVCCTTQHHTHSTRWQANTDIRVHHLLYYTWYNIPFTIPGMSWQACTDIRAPEVNYGRPASSLSS